MRDFAGKLREPIHIVVDSLQLIKTLIERPHLLHIFYIAKIFYSLPIPTMLGVYWNITKNEPLMQQDDRKKINISLLHVIHLSLLKFLSQIDILGSQNMVRHFDNDTVCTHFFYEPLCSSYKYCKMCHSSLKDFS